MPPLASKLLGLAARTLPGHWQARYGYRPWLLETFVEAERFSGTCYRAANWRCVGETQGRGKLGDHRLGFAIDGCRLTSGERVREAFLIALMCGSVPNNPKRRSNVKVCSPPRRRTDLLRAQSLRRLSMAARPQCPKCYPKCYPKCCPKCCRRRRRLNRMKDTNASLCRQALETSAEPIGGRSIPPLRLALLFFALCAVPGALLCAQGLPDPGDQPRNTGGSALQDDSPAPAKVDVRPVAGDEDIRQRLQRVLEATDWFIDPRVQVEEGVVFLTGQTDTDNLKKWAGDLARNTQDVVAVVNQTEVILPSVWDYRPAWAGVQALWRDLIRSLPFVVFGLFVLALSAGAGMLAAQGALRFVRRRIQARLLRHVIARAAGILMFLIGFYVVLRVSGLTQLALTVIGGTGLIGLIVGIAFRDITENFLSSIFLSMQRPFEMGDLVEMAGATGYVQQLNVRTTVLMTLDGNIVQIPNATVYKSNLRNFTTNANRRENFVIGIGYDDSITEAQEVARRVLANHPAVLNDPEPSVLVEDLGTSTVNLRVFFWLNGREHSWLKVRSSVIRLLKVAFQQHGISMPDEAREMVFPNGVPVVMLNDTSAPRPDVPAHMHRPAPSAPPVDPVSTEAEAGLYSEAGVIEEQARQARSVREGENLLPGVAASAARTKPAQAPAAPP